MGKFSCDSDLACEVCRVDAREGHVHIGKLHTSLRHSWLFCFFSNSQDDYMHAYALVHYNINVRYAKNKLLQHARRCFRPEIGAMRAHDPSS